MISTYDLLSGVLSVLVHVLVIGFVLYVRVYTSAVPPSMASSVFLVREVGGEVARRPAAVVVHPLKSPVRSPVRVPRQVADMRQILLRHLSPLPEHRSKNALRQSVQRSKSAQQPAENQKGAAEDRVLFLEYQQALIAHIRRFVLIPFEVSSRHPVIFDVTQSRDGRVIAVRLRHSSGNAEYDRAVERAIGLANPLPLPTAARLFEAHLVIRFYPS